MEELNIQRKVFRQVKASIHIHKKISIQHLLGPGLRLGTMLMLIQINVSTGYTFDNVKTLTCPSGLLGQGWGLCGRSFERKGCWG